jgi:hypothetical protein
MSTQSKRVFLSYAWESDEYRLWVERFATRLREDGIDARLDTWELRPNDSIPEFMNREIRKADWVLVLCSPEYQAKVRITEDGTRVSGVGWETRLLTGRILAANENKIIAVLMRGAWIDAAPDSLLSQFYYDLSDPETFEVHYLSLLQGITGTEEKAPPLRKLPENLTHELVEPLRGKPLDAVTKNLPSPFLQDVTEPVLTKTHLEPEFHEAPQKLEEGGGTARLYEADSAYRPETSSTAVPASQGITGTEEKVPPLRKATENQVSEPIELPSGQMLAAATKNLEGEARQDVANPASRPKTSSAAVPELVNVVDSDEDQVTARKGSASQSVAAGRAKEARMKPKRARWLAMWILVLTLGLCGFCYLRKEGSQHLGSSAGQLQVLEKIFQSQQLGLMILNNVGSSVQHDQRLKKISYADGVLVIDILSWQQSTAYLDVVYSMQGFAAPQVVDTDPKEDPLALEGFHFRLRLEEEPPEDSAVPDEKTENLEHRRDKLLALFLAPSTLTELTQRLKAEVEEAQLRLDSFKLGPAVSSTNKEDLLANSTVQGHGKTYFRNLVAFFRQIADLPYPVELTKLEVRGVRELDGLTDFDFVLRVPLLASGLKSIPVANKRTALPDSGEEPFRSSLRAEFAQQLSIDDLRLMGLYRTPGGFAAQVAAGPGGARFLLKEGDQLSDGSVLHVSLQGIVFNQDGRGQKVLTPG